MNAARLMKSAAAVNSVMTMVKRRMSFRDFCDAVREAVDSLPAQFRPYLENVVVDVDEEPSADDIARLEDREDLDQDESQLLGLFSGVPLTAQEYGEHHPNVVKIFRRPMERVCRTRRSLIRNIRATVIHEFAHHFGFSEADLEDFERSQAEYDD